jgi:hypothetical protein
LEAAVEYRSDAERKLFDDVFNRGNGLPLAERLQLAAAAMESRRTREVNREFHLTLRGQAFGTREEAEAWMFADVDDSAIDNVRFAFVDDREAMLQYEEHQRQGCCGFFDTEVLVDGKPAMIGCNFGH